MLFFCCCCESLAQLHRNRMGNRNSDQNENEWANDDDCLCISIIFLARERTEARPWVCCVRSFLFHAALKSHGHTYWHIYTHIQSEEAKHYYVEHGNPIRKKLRDENRKKQRLANLVSVCVCAEQLRSFACAPNAFSHLVNILKMWNFSVFFFILLLRISISRRCSSCSVRQILFRCSVSDVCSLFSMNINDYLY